MTRQGRRARRCRDGGEAPRRLPTWVRCTPEQRAELRRRAEGPAADLEAMRRARRA